MSLKNKDEITGIKLTNRIIIKARRAKEKKIKELLAQALESDPNSTARFLANEKILCLEEELYGKNQESYDKESYEDRINRESQERRNIRPTQPPLQKLRGSGFVTYVFIGVLSIILIMFVISTTMRIIQ